MTELQLNIIEIQDFRDSLFHLFKFRADSTMDFIDALAESSTDSVVKVSLSNTFRRTYSSITDVFDNMFRKKPDQNPSEEELLEGHLDITSLLARQCETEGKRGFALFAIDCTAKPRIYAKTVTDRSIVHAPNHVPGQKPITIGHEYSLVVFLPDDERDKNAHWTCPLSVRRVKSDETGPKVGFEQIKAIVTQTNFKYQLCVDVSDSAYSENHWILNTDSIPNLVHVTRARGNRVLYRQPKPLTGKKSRGRPKTYGEIFRLDNPGEADEESKIQQITKSGKRWTVHLSRWNNVLAKGSKGCHTEEHPFDVVRVQIFDSSGERVFKNPLWLFVIGQRRVEITSEQAYVSYGQRYDIEHCFRFKKQKLLFSRSQPSDTRHEENFACLSMLSYFMLYKIRHLASEVRLPWERRKVSVLTKTAPPTQVQRNYYRIIRKIGTPASFPKPRGKSPGRQFGAIIPHRNRHPTVRKPRRMANRC
jgi:hypothetical protein